MRHPAVYIVSAIGLKSLSSPRKKKFFKPMISRRNIRVKVMQLLYALETGEQSRLGADAVKTLKKQLTQSCDLFIYLLVFLTETARYAEKDAQKRALRNLPSQQDSRWLRSFAGDSRRWHAWTQSKPLQEAVGDRNRRPGAALSSGALRARYGDCDRCHYAQSQ